MPKLISFTILMPKHSRDPVEAQQNLTVTLSAATPAELPAGQAATPPPPSGRQEDSSAALVPRTPAHRTESEAGQGSPHVVFKPIQEAQGARDVFRMVHPLRRKWGRNRIYSYLSC